MLDDDAAPFPLKTVFEIPHRHRSPPLLLFGASLCVLGFATITCIGIIDFKIVTSNHALKLDYPSGYGYFPATVSEMVHKGDTPEGRVFYTFGLIAGFCLLVSAYPFHLRNVYTAGEKVPYLNMYWSTFRQVIPSMGLWLLIGVSTYPTPIALSSPGKTKMGCVLLHLIGAGMMFLGYLICELKCLGMCGLSRGDEFLAIKGRERTVRTILAWTILVGFVCFGVCQNILVLGKSKVCCADEWALNGKEIILNNKKHILHTPELINTASGNFLMLKFMSFLFEDIAGLGVVFSHIAIWYFCHERKVEYGFEHLRDPGYRGDSEPSDSE